MTYYGRWTYKYESAARAGAIGAILIHTDESAGYGWSVVRNSWGRERPHVALGAGLRRAATRARLAELPAGAPAAPRAGEPVDPHPADHDLERDWPPARQ